MKYSLNKYHYRTIKNFYGVPYEVIAESTYAGRKVRGVAKCDPKDTFSFEKGKQLAAARCNLKVATKRRARAIKRFDDASRAVLAADKFKRRMTSYLEDASFDLEKAKKELEELEATL